MERDGGNVVPLRFTEWEMNLLVKLGRMVDAVATGIGVVLGIVPDPVSPERDLRQR